MTLFKSKPFRRLLLCGAFATGVFCIVASGGSGGGSQPPAISCRLETSAIAPAADGSGDIWIGLVTKLSNSEDNSVTRLNASGVERFKIPVGAGPGNFVRTLAVATDGTRDVYVGGDFSGGIFRLDKDGLPNPLSAVGSGFNSSVAKITPAADGSGDIYVSGYFSEYNGATVAGLVRLDNTGALVTNFAGAQAVQDVALAGPKFLPGSVYSGGYVYPRIARWFSIGGTIDNNFFTALGPVFTVVPVDGTDTLYIGGSFSTRMLRLFDIGTTDLDFDVGSGFNEVVWKILRADDSTSGDVYAVGGFTTYDGLQVNGLVRLNADGSPDVDFVTGSGFTSTDGSTPFNEIASAALVADDRSGDLYVGGDFSFYNGAASNGIARLNVDGSLDTSFAVQVSSADGTCSNETIPGLN
jgi:hypothetical protein